MFQFLKFFYNWFSFRRRICQRFITRDTFRFNVLFKISRYPLNALINFYKIHDELYSQGKRDLNPYRWFWRPKFYPIKLFPQPHQKILNIDFYIDKDYPRKNLIESNDIVFRIL